MSNTNQVHTPHESVGHSDPVAGSSRPRWLRWIANGLLLVLLVVVWREFTLAAVVPAMNEGTWPYSAYWIAPRLALEGQADMVYAHGSISGPLVARLNVTGDILEVNAPTTWLPFLPLALIPISDAFHIWTVLNLVCFVIGWIALMRALRLPTGLVLLLTALVPLFEPFVENTRGQAYTVLFALVALSAVIEADARAPASSTGPGEARWRQVMGGVFLGVVAVFKLYYGLVLALPGIVKRRYIFVTSTALIVGAAVMVTVWAWGTGIWARYIPLSLTWRDRPETGHTAYQTTTSLLNRLFRFDGELNPNPVVNLPWLAASLWWLVTFMLLGVTLYTLWRSGKREVLIPMPAPAWYLLPTSAMVPLASVLAPIAEGYHYALCIFPAVVVLAVLWEAWWHRLMPGSRWGQGLPWGLLWASAGLVLAIVLLAWTWKYNVGRVDGWGSLMHYPRLYGGLLLWLLAVVLLARPGLIWSIESSK